MMLCHFYLDLNLYIIRNIMVAVKVVVVIAQPFSMGCVICTCAKGRVAGVVLL